MIERMESPAMIRAAHSRMIPDDPRLAGADSAAVGLELEGSSPAARDEIGLLGSPSEQPHP
jgi:hypothetical protein